MAYSKIIITQNAVSGAAGVARDDITLYTGVAPLDKPVYFSNDPDGNSGVISWQWTLIERPVGSIISLINPTSSICELRPDVYGTYVVSLSVNGLGRATAGYAETVIGCRYPIILPVTVGAWRIPAFLEKTLANWASNSRGAQPEIHKFMDEVYVHLMSFAGFLNRLEFEFPSHLATRTDIQHPNWSTVAFLRNLDMSDYPDVTSAYVYVLMLCEGGGGPIYATARLYDTTNVVAVVAPGISVTNSYPTEDTGAIAAIGANPGDLRNDGSTSYRLDITVNGGALGVNYAQIFEAGLVLVS